MHSQVLNVTPSLAEEWLKSNSFNRKISKATVRRYADDMKAGNWNLNHQGIAFDNDGVLVDGQHRLVAVIESGETIKMMVTWGSERTGIDELRPRSAYDVIRFGNLSDWVTPRHIQTANQMQRNNAEDNSARKIFSTTDQLAFAEKHRDAICFAESLFLTHTRGLSTSLARATIATAYYHYDHELLSDFVKMLYSGVVSSPSQSSVVRAREMLLDKKSQASTGERIRTVKRLARAIDAFCNNQPLSKLIEPSVMPFRLEEK